VLLVLSSPIITVCINFTHQ